MSRLYTSRRFAIANAAAEKIKDIDGLDSYVTDLEHNVEARLRFWDDVESYPHICVVPGPERRDYDQGAGMRTRYMTLIVHIYVKDEDGAMKALEGIIEDVETVMEENARLFYVDRQGNSQCTHDIKVTNIDTDEGVLDPYGIGQVSFEVRY